MPTKKSDPVDVPTVVEPTREAEHPPVVTTVEAPRRRLHTLAIAGITLGGVVVAGALFGGGVIVGTAVPHRPAFVQPMPGTPGQPMHGEMRGEPQP